jgi:hypothetical protein
MGSVVSLVLNISEIGEASATEGRARIATTVVKSWVNCIVSTDRFIDIFD